MNKQQSIKTDLVKDLEDIKRKHKVQQILDNPIFAVKMVNDAQQNNTKKK